MQPEKESVSPNLDGDAIDVSDWQSRIILGRQVGANTFNRPLPDWLPASYERLRADVMDPGYPCFFGTQAEKRGEMFYSWIDGKDISSLPDTMASFAELAQLPQYEKNNIAIFFEPDEEPLAHAAYHDAFWQTLQYLHDRDPDPKVGQQLDPSHPDWEFSFAGLETFVVCACPSFGTRHSRNLGPGMVLLFQPRAVFVDKVTNRAISTQARSEVRRRLNIWDEVPPHADLGYFGDAENREWKQYFLPDDETPNFGACPFLRRNPGAMKEAVEAAQAASVPRTPVTLLDALAVHLAHQPDQIAIRFLADGERDERTLTYRELDARARQLAATLLTQASPGDRAMLLLPSGLDYAVAFLGCLHAGIAAVPVYPPEPTQPQQFERLLAILGDAQPRLLLTDLAHAGAVNALATEHSEGVHETAVPITLPVDATTTDDALAIALNAPVSIDGSTIAFLQYTSGSTSTAKGVMVSHANLVANERAISSAMAFTSADTMVSWLPLFHDMGLIGGLLAPLFGGFPLVLLSPQHFLEAPARWLKAIANYRGTVSGGPNFAYQLCADRVRSGQLDGIKLDSWRVAFCGAEPIRAETLMQFAAQFGMHDFNANALFPCYGLAEATLLVSGAEPGHGMKVRHVAPQALSEGALKASGDGVALVSCGRVPDAHSVLIVDPATQAQLADEQIGEIWVNGPSVANGYWRNEEASAETFVTSDTDNAGAQHWLRTGDLGCVVDGELFVTGRVKDLIIVRGQNYYPQDIEATLTQKVDKVRKGRIIAFAANEQGVEGIGIAAEVSRAVAKADPAELFAQINRAVAQAHGEPVSVIVLLAPGDLPRTSSGKLRRSACATAWRDGALPTVAVYRRASDTSGNALARAPYRAPQSAVEQALVEQWEAVFDHAPLGIDDDFFDLGGDSLKAARLAARVGETFSVTMPPRIVFEARTVALQAEWVTAMQHAGRAVIAPLVAEPAATSSTLASAQRDGTPHPLSPAQEALYFEWKLDPASTAYHVSGALRARGPLDVARLHQALAEVCASHDALRVRFDERDGVPYQQAIDAPRFDWHVTDVSSFDAASREAHLQDQLIAIAHAPFDLHHGALLRATLVRVAADEHVLQLTMHHIVADAWSFALIIESLFQRYENRVVSGDAQPCAYFTSVEHERRALSAARIDEQLTYWRAQLGSQHTDIMLSGARRDAPRDSAGARVTRRLPADLVARIGTLARSHGLTLPMTLMAAFAALLYRYGGQTDIRIGVPLNNRRDASAERAIGYFVNTVVVRVALAGALPFASLLRTTRDALLDAQAHQDVPFHRVVAALQPQRDNGRTPLFQVAFNFDQVDWKQVLRSSTLQLQRVEHGAEATPFDLALNLSRDDDGVQLAFEYPVELFDGDTVEQFADAYLAIVAQAAEDASSNVRDFVLQPSTSAAAVLQMQPKRATQQAAQTSLTAQFTRTANIHPDRIALECDAQQLSYGELDRWSDRIAQRLLDAGVRGDECVGLCVERSPGMIAALLGIWKAGAAFVPLDPVYPAERLRYMLDDACVRVVVSDTVNLETLADVFDARTSLDIQLDIHQATATITQSPQSTQRHVTTPHPDQLAYTIYTSGSTGLPKGVAVSHRALALHLADFIDNYAITEHDCQLQSSTINFDVALHEMLPALLMGGRVVMRGPQAWDLATLSQRLINSRVTFARMPTAYWQQWLQSPPARASLAALRQITVGGEALPGDALARWNSGPLRAIHVDNLYGPTETTVACLHRRTSADDAQQPIVQIGTPFPSRTAQVVDVDGNAVPVGGIGELCIGGDTLARGYVGQAALTAERFVPDPDGSPGARCYRSGDLCRRRADGGFDFLGRIDRQIKLRGFRIEPGEIEAMLRQCDGVRDAAVEARSKDGHLRLVGYVAGAASLDLRALRDTLEARLPSHMVPAVLMQLDTLPLMLNGKIDRAALPEPVESAKHAEASVREPRNRHEADLLDIWRAVLGTQAIGVDDNFFAVGGDSILSLQVVSRAAQRGMHFTLKQFYAQPVISRLAQLPFTITAGDADQAMPSERHEPLPLTPIQTWFFERFPEGESHWNQTVALRVQGEFDPALLKQALHAVVAAHDALRLKFVRSPGGWWQQVQPRESMPSATTFLEVVDFDGTADSPQWPERLLAIGTSLQQSLDIETGKLLNATYVRLQNEGRLLLTIHHLAVDGMSWRVLLESFQLAYEQLAQQQAVELPGGLPWSAWVQHQQDAADETSLEAEFDAWHALLAGSYSHENAAHADLEAAQIVQGSSTAKASAREERPTVGTSQTQTLKLSADLTGKLLRDAPAAARATTETLLLAALTSSLNRWSGARGALLSLEGHGRDAERDLNGTANGAQAALDTSRTVGWFTTRYPAWFDLRGGDPLVAATRTLRAIPLRGAHWHRVRERFANSLPAPQISFNYLGRFDQSLPQTGSLAGRLSFALDDNLGAAVAAHTPLDYALDINAWISNGRLTATLRYDPAHISSGVAESLASGFETQLAALIDRCISGDMPLDASDFPLAQLDQPALDALNLERANVQDLYPATPLQKGLLFHALMDGGHGLYVNQLRLTLEGPLDHAALAAAWRNAVARHDILRTSFVVPPAADPLQLVQRRVELPFVEYDWSALEPADYERDLQAWCDADRRQGFDPARAPLLRFALFTRADGQHDLVRTLHHALLDGWSSAQLLGEIADDYVARVAGETPPQPEAIQYRRYVEWLSAQTPPRDWWLTQLERHPEPATLLQHEARAAQEHGAALTHTQHLGEPLVNRLRDAAQRHRVTVNTLVQAAWALVLARRGNRRHVAFGTTVAGRPAQLDGAQRMVGLFINSLPAWIEVPAAQRVSAWLSSVHAAQGERHQAEHTSLADLQQWTGKSGDALFDSLLVFENYPVDAALRGRFGRVGVSHVESVERTHYPLTLLVSNDAQGRVVWLADGARVAQPLLLQLAAAWRDVLAALSAADADDQAVGNLMPNRDAAAAEASHEVLRRVAGHRFVPIGARLAAQAARKPAAHALGCEGKTLSYAALDAWSNRIGRRLKALGARAEQRIGLCVERSVEMVAGLYGIAKTGAAYVPLDPHHPPQRLQRILDDAGVDLIVTDDASAARLAACFAGRTLVRVNDVHGEAAHGWSQPIDPQQAAYVIYTSGSTGEPKGVCVTHASLDRLLASVAARIDFSDTDVWLSVTTLSFDIAGLELHLPLTRGARVELASRETVLDGARLLRLIGQSGATVMQATPAGWRMLLDSETRAGVALSGPLQALCGGEALPADLASALLERGVTLSNMYGPTETTIWSSMATVAADQPVTLGVALHDTTLRVLDQDGLPTAAGAVGELCIGGDNLARGYHGRASLTAASFVPDPFGAPGSRLYRTGDLSRKRADGGLDYLGRLDQQLKLRGHRIEPAEIETALRALDGVRDAAVVLRHDDGAARLVAYLVSDTALDDGHTPWRSALAERLPAALIPSAWVVLDALPLTPSGKIDRRNLPAPAVDTAATAIVAPRNELEAQLLAIWRTLLPSATLGVTTDFFAAGGDSIVSLRMVGAALEAGFDLTPRQVFQNPTVEQLARVAQLAAPETNSRTAAAADIAIDVTLADSLQLSAAERAGLQDLCVATPLQQGLLSLAQRSTRDPYYLQRVFELKGPFSPDAFAAAWRAVVARHPALRTDFRWDGLDTPLQLVRQHVEIEIRSLDWSHLTDGEARDALASQWRDAQSQGFDFADAAHAQLLLIERHAGCRWFVWRFHHAQLDGWSIGLVLRDVLQAYDRALSGTTAEIDVTAPPAPAFAHYVRWLEQKSGAANNDDTAQKWRDLLTDWSRTPLPLAAAEHATSALPEHAQTSEQIEHTVRLPRALTAQADRFARACGVTLNTLLQGAWAWLLSRHANRRDVSFGVTVSGRGDGWPNAGETVGLFINTLPLTVQLPPSASVRTWLNALQTRNLALQELAQTPLAQLQREITGAANEPLFDSIFVFENYPLDAALRAPLVQGLAIERLATGIEGHSHDGRNHFPLSLIAVPGDELILTLAAQSARFDSTTVQRLLAQLQQTLGEFIVDPERALGVLHVRGEAHPAMSFDNDGFAPSAWNGGMLARIAQHARSQPTAIALHDESGTLDWATLWQRSGSLAARLVASGVRIETVVAVVLPRRADLIVAMLAIWRAGGVYLPLDPLAPAERLHWQIRDAQAQCVIADNKADHAWRPDDIALVEPSDMWETASASAGHDVSATAHADLAAYLIYTSGSTGTPKGVLVSHRSLAAYTEALLARLPGGIRSAVYLSTPAADLGHSTLMAALYSGWTLQLIDEQRAFDADRYADWCRANPADLLKIAPSHLEGLLNAADPASVIPRKALLLGGETSAVALLERVGQLHAGCAIIGHYGPTESTVGVMTSERDASGRLPLGHALDHARVYLLDPDGHPALDGARGELHVGGVALARGYRGRAMLTADRFAPDPFVAGARVYRTGDQARRRDDGQLEFLGRVDDQLKIRGYRVEPAEVATQLRALPGVRDAVVIGRADKHQRVRLLGYVVGQDLDATQLRDALAARLPAALVPASIEILDVLPLTRNGKIDRAALPEPREFACADSGVAPETPLQHALLAVWRDVLRQPALGIDDNFFAAGGDSINAFQVVAQARRAGLVFSSRDLFARPSVRALCAVVQTGAANQSNGNESATAAVQPLDAQALAALGFDPQRVYDAYPATPMQQGLLFHSIAQQSGDGGMYITQRRLTLTGTLDIERLRAVWQHAVERHDILRTRFEWRDDAAWQVVERHVELPFGVHESRDETLAAYETRFVTWMRDDLARGFDPARAPLTRLDLFARPDGAHDLVWTTHHALLDGWSAARLLAETGDAYRAVDSDRTARHSATPYRAYIEWLAAQTDAREWWCAAAAACDDPALLTTSVAAPRVAVDGAYRTEFALDAALDARLHAAAGSFGVTLNTLMQSAWALLLARLGNREQVAFGTTVSGRPESLDGADEMLGLFINSLPVWATLPGAEDVGGWLRRMQAQSAEMRRHEHTPLAHLQRWVGRSGDALFDSLFVFENYPLDAALDALSVSGERDGSGGLRVSAVQSVGRTHYPLTLMVVPQPTLTLEWEWDGLRLDRPEVELLSRGYVELLEQLVQCADGESRELRSLTLSAPKRDAVPLDGHAFVPVVQRVAEMASSRPDVIAVRGEGISLTYRELMTWASAIAERLARDGVEPDSCVAVCIARGPSLLAAMLGVWMAGAAYLPVDPAYPADRIAAMLDDAEVLHVLADTHSSEHAFAARNVVDVRALHAGLAAGTYESNGRTEFHAPPALATIHPDQLAYVIYTSGSTGKPKGVGVTHGALDRLVASIELSPGLRDDDLWLSESAPVFDISLLEFCLPLVRGVPLEMVSSQTARDGFALAARLEASQATVFQATPSGWRMLLEAGWRDDRSAVHRPLLGLSGGEPLHPDLAAALIARGVSLWNLYGPTETTIYSSGAQVFADQPITHGDPLPETVLRVIDQHGLAVPDGGLGELCIGGSNLARGYLRRPGLTAERFVPDPDGAPGARLYRTGDLCRLDENGRPQPLGRLDQQIKLRGFRIEPGEIEAALCACEGVKNAAVAIKGEGSRQRLIGYVTGTAQGATLRAQLSRTLPAHMLPSTIVTLDALPLTPSGKLDRRALPEPAWENDDNSQAVAPRSPREAALLDIWQTVLGHPVHSVDVNFFEAGGDSISGVRVAARINQMVPRNVPLAALFQHPTIRTLADYLDAETARVDAMQADAATLSQLLADLE
ncbi:non-ribosomal peptide synthase domain TIGR01720/amino acid adenylation domain-containing protein [Paraburkholderia fungorum]|uniref:Non-ribosomal peptide synthase domain TIGR01720/amino acid adenylation domain-containing protein n=1 Tax=Paraburkholderia fungorum TaxID=134537 RepID=A0A1H1H9P2_9BURK|nr:non-ribosomal peptide synthetase [Paraburkholderia fungorum]SDR22089.1 non-ribosomal peptide synthase domain TIGR01720/amino acid adenylation domain-containing protein [Paraburkholderia fungorum]